MSNIEHSPGPESGGSKDILAKVLSSIAEVSRSIFSAILGSFKSSSQKH